MTHAEYLAAQARIRELAEQLLRDGHPELGQEVVAPGPVAHDESGEAGEHPPHVRGVSGHTRERMALDLADRLIREGMA